MKEKIGALLFRLFGKKIVDGAVNKFQRTKVIAVVGLGMYVAETVLPAFGVNVTIPSEVYRVLEMCGLWTLRDAIKSQEV